MIEVSRVSVVAGGETLLAPVDLTVRAGELTAVRGENGSGKTTLLRTIVGKLRPTTGAVTVAGRAVDDRDAALRRHVAGGVGMPPLARDLTLHEHLMLVATSWGHGRAARRAAESALSDLGIARHGGRFPHELSSGQLQLAALALVLVRPFDVLVLDEPEQRLDDERVGRVIDMLDRARGAGAAVVVATHSDRIGEHADVVLRLAAA